MMAVAADDSGSVVKFFIPARMEKKLGKHVEAGMRLRVAGEVKDHGEYNGEKNTMLGRVALAN